MKNEESRIGSKTAISLHLVIVTVVVVVWLVRLSDRVEVHERTIGELQSTLNRLSEELGNCWDSVETEGTRK